MSALRSRVPMVPHDILRFNFPMATSPATTESLRELEHRLNQRLPGQAHFDALTRVLYSTDASIHQIEPLGVVYPRQADDLCAAVEAAAELKIPVLPRGAGT